MLRKIYRTIERYMLRRWRWYAHSRLYVIADATDNSITFSKALFRLLNVMDKDEEPKVYVFRIANFFHEYPKNVTNVYGFCLNPSFGQETQLADIQYNSKHHCVGFECLCPTVNRIFYDYNLKPNTRVKLSVEYGLSLDLEYYTIMPPYGKSHR